MLVRKGDVAYEDLEYFVAAEKYEKALEKKDFPDALANLADSYRLMNRTEDAEKYYAQLVERPGAEPLWKLHYAQMLQINGKCEEAIPWFEQYVRIDPSNQVANNQLKACRELSIDETDDYIYEVRMLEINTGESSFGPTIFKDGIVFSSDRSEENDSDEYGWTGQKYLNLYYSKADSNGMFQEPEVLEGVVKSKFHEGPAVFDTSGNTIYFTRTDLGKRTNRPGKNDADYSNLQLFTARWDGSTWSNLEEMPFNNQEYSVGHPAISKDGNTMYFISDMPGSIGGTDLYKSTKDETGTWSAPENLGPDINTEGDEMFPFFMDTEDKKALYFSSNGLPGFGGMDIYARELNDDGSWGKMKHYPAPVNSSKDDFGVALKGDGELGYFTSTRSNSEAFDKLYELKIKERPVLLEGLVVDKNLEAKNYKISNAMVYVKNKTTGVLEDSVRANQSGFFSIEIHRNAEYELTAERKGYVMHESGILSTYGLGSVDKLNTTVTMKRIYTGMIMAIENIYYDYDKFNIREDALPVLDTVVRFLQLNDDVKIELSSHTDARASKEYNVKLSQKRAESAVNYIVSKGISQERIVAKGYGEEKLVNDCRDYVECTEEKHQENRRTEFTITESASDEVIVDTRNDAQ